MDTKQPTTGSLVWHLAMRWRAEVDRAVSPLGLTHAQYSALASLHAMTARGLAPTQRELADYTRLNPIYISKLVRGLEQAGWIERTGDPTDTRAYRLALTAAGTATIVQARAIVTALDDTLTEPIGGAKGQQTAQLVGLLRLLIDHHDGKGDRQ